MSANPAPDQRLNALAFAALGVVYADIGTSPLYTVRECFRGPAAVSLDEAHVLGVLSLIVWSLLFLVSLMYLQVILRVDNEGEGGVLALAALVSRAAGDRPAFRRGILVLGLFGASLLYGDGLLTPAISVMSAVEGLEVYTPLFTPYVVPITVAILVALFAIQRRGTAAIGAMFGPVTLGWFGIIGALGLVQIARVPGVLRALDPRHGMALLTVDGARSLLILGPVFLAITGAETLYADLGHFGRRPIVRAWSWVVLPALLLNYLGQGALLLAQPSAVVNPFFHLAPGWFLLPLVALASAATVIASQGNISEVFSLTRQAILLGYLPRTEIRHTSPDEMGQVYVPYANWALLAATLLLVIGARSSSRLTSAYGVNVATTVLITSILSFFALRDLWGWRGWFAALVSGAFLFVASLFFAANAAKVLDGGWLPLSIAIAAYTVMTTWKAGRELLAEKLKARATVDSSLQSQLDGLKTRVPGVAVYLTGLTTGLPPALVQNLRHLHCLHERVLFLTFVTEARSYVPTDEQVQLTPLGHEIYRVVVHHGFMEHPSIPEVLRRTPVDALGVDAATAVFVLGRETLVPGDDPALAGWRRALFRLLARNASTAPAFFGVPPDRVLEVGLQIPV